MAKPEEVLARLAVDLVEALGNDLLSVAVHGSWALGDFTPGHSDLDVLAVLSTDPTPATLTALQEVHARLGTDFPEWGDGHVEVEYVSGEAIRAVVQGTNESHPMISVGKGDPLHEHPASRHSVLNWAAALQADQPIAGAAPSTVLRAIDQQLIRQVILQHVRGWPEWVEEMQHAGGQAYAVLTLCRAAEALETGQQVSKRAAAEAGRSRFPEWSALIGWARDWWYRGGSDSDSDRFEEVRRFVVDVSARLLKRYDSLPPLVAARSPVPVLPSPDAYGVSRRDRGREMAGVVSDHRLVNGNPPISGVSLTGR